jgi:ubiquitin fusion degradation protein 1
MLFKLTSLNEHTTHSGVLEFTAEEGCCYIPFWMMQNLLIEEGALITVANVSLPKATFVKLQPQSVDFLEISNPRAVLEHALRNFSCVTAGDTIQIPYNNKNYHFALQEVKPSPAACIIETDCNVDFDAPVGYQDPTPSSSQRSSACPSPTTTMSTSSSLPGAVPMDVEPVKPSGTRIVNGEIVRPQDSGSSQSSAPKISEMVAERIGQTGVQQNAAIPAEAPAVAYWAIQAGDGARLDGKKVAELKDAAGNAVDIRQLRAEAAARRAAEEQSVLSSRSDGQALNGKEVIDVDEVKVETTAVPMSKRKNRVGSKFSRLKTSSLAFQGSANSFS